MASVKRILVGGGTRREIPGGGAFRCGRQAGKDPRYRRRPKDLGCADGILDMG